MTKFFTHDNVRFGYETSGAGSAVILLHGLGGDRSGALALADDQPGWQRIAFDQRGHGQTEFTEPEERFSFAVLANDLRALLDECGIDRAVLAGVSMGAGVALRFALDHLARVRALILVRPAWLHYAVTDNLRPYLEIARLLRAGPAEDALAEYRASADYARIKEASGHAAQTITAQFLAPTSAKRAARLDRMSISTPYSEPGELADITVPTWVIGCEEDFFHPMAFAAEWTRLIPGARLHKVISTAHDVPGHRQAVRDLTRRILVEIDEATQHGPPGDSLTKRSAHRERTAKE